MLLKLRYSFVAAFMLISAFAVAQSSDLQLTLQVNDLSPNEGQNIEFKYVVKNLGPNAATNIQVDDLLPAGFTYVSDNLSGPYNSGTDLWNIATLNSGATFNLKIIAYANAGTNGTTITAAGYITALDQTDPNSTNDNVSTDIPINYPDLEVTKTVNNSTPQVGETIEYTIKVKHLNTTTLAATNVLIEDILPSSVTYVLDDSGGTYNAGTGIWNIGTLTAGQQEQIKIDVTINTGTSGTDINNLAQVLSFDQNDLNQDNNESNVEIIVATADLTMTKQVNDSSPDEGDTIEFTLKVKNDNASLSDASNILVTDVLPAGLTYISDDSGGAYNDATGIWTVPGILIPGNQEQIKITVTVDANTAAQTITNTSAITSFDQVDDNRSDNIASVEVLVNGADLEITKTVDDTNPAVNDIIRYTINVTNNGHINATNVVIQDVIAGQLTYQTSAATQGAYASATGLWTLGNLNVGVTETLTIDVQVGNGANRKLITNTASIFSVDQADSITDNDSDDADIGVGSADLSLVKSVDVATQNEGGNVIYTIQVTNNSTNTPAFATSVTDLLPTGVTYFSDDSALTTTTYDSTTGLWDIGRLNQNATITLNITCSVDAGTGGLIITNTATGTSIMEDTDLTNNTDDASFQVNGADLQVTKIVDNEFPTESDFIVYTVTVTNNGPDDATNVTLFDELPFSVNYIGDTASQGSYDYLTGIWNIGTIANGNTVTLTVNTQVRIGGAFTNTATISGSDQPDANTANNTDSARVSAQITFDAGASIIDMGVPTQTINNGLAPYGLVYDLSINNKVPIYWVVNHTKSWVSPTAKQDQKDINIAGKDYKGGPFVIPAEFMGIAQPIIDTWVANYPGLTVDANLPQFDAPVYDYITSFPRAVLDTQNGDKVQDAFYDKSGVPITFGRIGTPDDLTNCDDMYTMPHADPQNWSTATVNNLISFIQQGGYFWAACHAVSAMEGAVDTNGDGNPDLNLLSNNGLVLWGDHSNGTPPYNYNIQTGIFNGSETAGDPLMQFIGTMDGALQSGSEQIYIPEIEGWRDSTILALTDDDHPEVISGEYPTGPAVALAYGRAFGDNTQGMVMYEASHKIQGGTEAEDVAAARVYGNFLLQAGIERRPKIKMGTIPPQLTIGTDFSVVAEVSGIAPPFTYEWTDTCGGTFSDPNALGVTYTPNPAIVDQENCIITFEVTDSCGRRNFTSFSVIVDKDTDLDGIINTIDIDDDNDGILDTIENNGNEFTDSDEDGIYDRLDLDADGDGILDIIEGGLTTAQISIFDTDGDGFIDLSFTFGANGFADLLETTPESGTPNYSILNSDTDTNDNFQDIDADNDGIPDNVELQPTIGYIAPAPEVSEFGINNNYLGGMTLTHSDLDTVPDYLDTDSDEDGIPDIEENGMSNAINGIDTDSDGLDDAFEGISVNDPADVNDDINLPEASILPDNDNDVFIGGDLDYRDSSVAFPPENALIDFDGVDDYTEMTSSILDGYSDFTISLWIKYNGPDLTGSDEVFVMGQKGMFEITLADWTGDPEDIGIRAGFFKTNGLAQKSGWKMNSADWTHFTVTASFDGTNTSYNIYRNGYKNGSSNVVGTINTNSSPFRIGIPNGSSSYINFEGWIDEVRIFNSVLTEDQIRRMVYQEIENNAGNVRGKIIPKNIVDIDTNVKIPWANLVTYYTMSNLDIGTTSYLEDDSSYNNRSTLNNITSFLEQTAPMPFETINANKTGDWTDATVWKHGDVWDITDLDEHFVPSQSPEPWSIVRIHDNITSDVSRSSLGLFIDENKTLTVTGDNAITNNWYLDLDGTIDLLGDSQLVQTEHSELAVSSFGNILRRQEGASNLYWYNYWSSPIGQLSTSQNNTPYSLAILKDPNGNNLNFTSAYNPPLTNPVTISDFWLYTFSNGVTYNDWDTLDTDTFIQPGTGYTQKGTGAAGLEQQYLFDGKPNNGTISLNGVDTGGPGGEQDTTLTNYLVGNPYASALDGPEFIRDNASVIGGTLRLWEQWDGNSHYLAEYQGGYGTITEMATERAYQYPGIPIADNNGDGEITIEDGQGIKTPTFYIPVGQAFFVEVENNGLIEFNNSQRIFKQEALGESVFLRNTTSNTDEPVYDPSVRVNPDFGIIRLEFATSEGATRRFILGFNENTTDAFDYGFDGGRIEDTNDEDMGSLLDDKQYILQAFSPITPTKEIELFLNTSGNWTYSLDIVELLNIDPSQDIYLRDNQENIYWDLRQGPYNFSTFAGLDTDRFDIVFQPGETLSTTNFNTNDLLIYVNNDLDKLFIKGLTEDINTLTITNLLGQTVKRFTDINKSVAESGILVNDLSAGIYIVNIETDTKEQGKKVVID